MSNETFDQWAIVELMGHQKMAGHVTEAEIGGCSFVRVDVPEIGDQPTFTRLLGKASIYAINIVTEEVARAAAEYHKSAPFNSWEIHEVAELVGQQQRIGHTVEHNGEDWRSDE